MQPPPTEYVERDGVSIAFQVLGDGPVDLLLSPGFISHLDLAWTDPGTSRLLGRLASFARLILYDKPGTGLSDPIANLPTLEERGADIEAVLDAVGSKRAVLFGVSEGGPTSVLFAATRPERITSLILYGTFAVMPHAAPEAYAPEVTERTEAEADHVRDAIKHWGDGTKLARVFAPSLSERQMRIWGTFARAAASPRMAQALVRTAMQIDVRDVLSSVHAPTLVLHLDSDCVMPLEAGELLAAGIPDARFMRFPGTDHVFWLGQMKVLADEIVDQIEQFVTGTVSPAIPDRVLSSVLFTDIVASTTRAAELGDSAWRDVLERHDALVDRTVAEHGGRVVKHIGDGALSAFDGPAMAMRCRGAA
jgi:pimeloyl-ACP methyl ester carboxylesterase